MSAVNLKSKIKVVYTNFNWRPDSDAGTLTTARRKREEKFHRKRGLGTRKEGERFLFSRHFLRPQHVAYVIAEIRKVFFTEA